VIRFRLALLFSLFVSPAAAEEDLYDFVSNCRAASPMVCLGRIEDRIDRLRSSEEGMAFCIPRSWGATHFANVSYPLSMLDYMLLRLSAARIGRAGEQASLVIRDTLAELFPCRNGKRR
jgi:hypothetical protein